MAPKVIHCPFDGWEAKLNQSGDAAVCRRMGCPCSYVFTLIDEWNKRGPHEELVKHIPVDEPIFVVRAQDKLGPGIVTQWILEADTGIGVPLTKIDSACADRDAMERWQMEHGCKVPD